MDVRLDSHRAQHEPLAPGPESAQAELAAFTYAVTHDLKEPLFGIETYASALLDDYGPQLDEPGRQLIAALVDLAGRERRMIDAVHAYATYGRVELSREPVDMHTLVDDVLDGLLPELVARHVQVRVAGRLPEVDGDPTLLEHVWHHLILNAAIFNDRADKWIEIGSRPPAAGTAPVFYVRDNGIGIAEHDQASVFSMFARLVRREPGRVGVGAGLTLAARIVTRHGGRIWVDSRLGDGSTFSFTLGEQPAS